MSLGKHIPCGHWHKVPIAWGATVTPPASLGLTEWNSCPQTAWYGNGTTDIFFATTDHLNPTSTLYIIKYNRTADNWSVVYSTTKTNDVENSLDYRWAEPPVGIAVNGTKFVLELTSMSITDYSWALDTYAFNGETLVRYNQYSTISSGDIAIGQFKYSQPITVDALGNFHAIKVEYHNTAPKTGYIYDLISSDGGDTFTPVLIASELGWLETWYAQHIFVDPSDNIWAVARNRIYKSTDHGANWSYITTPGNNIVPDIKYLNDALFYINNQSTVTTLYRSTNEGTSWTAVLTVNTSYPGGGCLGFDGTTYYCILNFRNPPGGFGSTGYNSVYTSVDGATWTLASTITGDDEKGTSDQGSTTLSILGSNLLYTYYYASTLLADHANTYMMTVWESTDSGATWTAIQTPFYDTTTGEAP